MMLTRATEWDVPVVTDLLNDAAAWLEARGVAQWNGGFDTSRVYGIVARGGTYIVWQLGDPVATITAHPAGDPALWSPAELAEPATYISKMATVRAVAGRGIGADLLGWVLNAAHERGDRWVRLDAWRENPGLHRYYERAGFRHVRTVAVPGRNSGALFQRLALPGRHPFTCAPPLAAREPAPVTGHGVIPVGAGVFTEDWRHGVVAEVHGPDWTAGIVPQPWDGGMATPPVSYTVRLDDGQELLTSEVTEAASVTMAEHV